MRMLPVASLRSYVMLSAEDTCDFAFRLDSALTVIIIS
jgi:hypothetical protein